MANELPVIVSAQQIKRENHRVHCADCIFFDQHPRSNDGQCHAHPPRTDQEDFPFRDADDWCGEARHVDAAPFPPNWR